MFLLPMSATLRQSISPVSNQEDEEDTDNLYAILKKMSDEDCSDCTKFFTDMALASIKEKEEIVAESNPKILLKYIRRGIDRYRSVDERDRDWLALQAIFGHVSHSEDNCRKLLENGLLLALHDIREKYSDDLRFISTIAQLVAIITQFVQLRDYFKGIGWIRVLADWLQDPRIDLSLPATKALHNLDRAPGSSDQGVVYNKSVYLLHPIHRSREYDVDIVFVHGLMGSVFKTWRQCNSSSAMPNCEPKIKNNDTMDSGFDDVSRTVDLNGSEEYTRCWPQTWLPKDVRNCRVLAVNYHTYLSNWNLECPVKRETLEDKAKSIERDLIAAGLGSKPIVFIGHSMGGLLIKKLLVNCAQSENDLAKRISAQVRGVVFYSVPHRGSNLVWPIKMKRLALPSNEVLELCKGSPSLLALHDQFVSWASGLIEENNLNVLSFGETKRSTFGLKNLRTLMVTQDSANPGIGEFRLMEDTDHFDSCKPRWRGDLEYRTLVNFIEEAIKGRERNIFNDISQTVNCKYENESKTIFEKCKNLMALLATY